MFSNEGLYTLEQLLQGGVKCRECPQNVLLVFRTEVNIFTNSNAFVRVLHQVTPETKECIGCSLFHEVRYLSNGGEMVLETISCLESAH